MEFEGLKMCTFYDCIFKTTDPKVANNLAFDYIMQPNRFVRCLVEFEGIVSLIDEFASRWKWEHGMKV